MTKSILTLLFIVSYIQAGAQYFQQDIQYDIAASYDQSAHTIEGKLALSYTNNAPTALDTMYLHLWANALESKTSPYAEQLIKLGNTKYYFSDESNLGGYSDIQLTIADRAVELQYSDPSDKEIAYILLPNSLETGQQVNIAISYKLQMPYKFDRLGWTADGVQLVHWYPTPAVYDKDGWHTMNYLSMGELYSAVGDYKVKLDLPFEKYVASASIDGTKYTKNLTDFAVVANDTYDLIAGSVEGVSVKYLHHNNPHIEQHGMDYLADALRYYTEAIGEYPHASLGIVESGPSGGMEYSGVVTVGAKDNATFQYYLVHELVHQWFYGSLVTDQRTEGWLDEGFTTYYQQRYYEEVLGKDHYSDILPAIHGKKDGLPFLQKMAMAQAYRAFDQPICTHVDEVSVINYGFNSYEIPARWIHHMEGYIGREQFDEGIHNLYQKWKGKNLKAADIQQVMEAASGKKLDWLFEEMVTGQWAVDYSIKKTNENEITVRNNGQFATPYALTQTDKVGKEKAVWYEAHTDPKVISDFDLSAGSIKLGPENGLIDRNVTNNKLGSKPIKFVPVLGLDDNDYKEIYVLPLVNYNTSDGITAGAVFYNSTLGPKRWKFMLAPQYGFQSKDLVGHAWTSYDQYLEHPKFRKIVYKLGVKSYYDQFNADFDASSRYLKIDPTISLHFRHEADSHKYSKVTFKNINIANFKGRVQTDTLTSTIFQLRYESFNFYELSPSDVFTMLEYQSYENAFGESHNYLKLITSYKKSWLYSPTKKVSFRLFGSYFLVNSRRESSSYNPQLTRGSTALMHQGFNDYTYEEYWYNRGNQNQGIWGQQVSNFGGGFKTALGSQHSLGQTNDLALSLNFEADLPVRFPKFLPLGVFVDVGYFTGKNTESEDLTGNTLFSTGVALNYGEGLFSIYLPLYNNSAISDIFDANGTNLLGKITFRMDLNRFNPWELVEDYNF